MSLCVASDENRETGFLLMGGGGGVQPLIKKTRKFFFTTIAWMSQEYLSTSKFQIIRDFANTGVRMNAGLAKLVPGPSRGVLFRKASILVVVWDAEPKRDCKLSESCMLANLSYFYDGPRRSLICVRRWKIWRKISQLFPVRESGQFYHNSILF